MDLYSREFFFIAYCVCISLLKYRKLILNNDAAHSDTTLAKMLVGNKCDLENIREVPVEEAKALAESEGLFFMETSALDSTNVKTAFELVIKDI